MPFGGSYILNVYTAHGSSVVSHCLHMGFPYMSGTLHVMIAGTCDSNAYTKQRNVASACFVLVLKMMTECGFPFRCCGFREANYVRISITSNTLCTCEIKGLHSGIEIIHAHAVSARGASLHSCRGLHVSTECSFSVFP